MFVSQSLVCCDYNSIAMTRPSWLVENMKKILNDLEDLSSRNFFGVFFARSNTRLWVCLVGCCLGLNKHDWMICYETEHVFSTPKWLQTSDIDLHFKDFILSSPDFHLNQSHFTSLHSPYLEVLISRILFCAQTWVRFTGVLITIYDFKILQYCQNLLSSLNYAVV